MCALLKISFISIIWLSICESQKVYQDRPKIKTDNGDLILEAAVNKNIYLRPNGPKSTVFLGDISLLNVTGGGNSGQYNFKDDDIDKYLNGPNGILNRINKLETKTYLPPSDVSHNLTVLWRRIQRQTTIIAHLRRQINERKNDECLSRPCQNGGTCLNLATGYFCLCPSNWEGNNCDTDVNECRNFAGTDLGCQNGGECKNKPGSYECQCKGNWIGVHCTTTSKDCSGGNYETCGHGTCINNPNSKDGIICLCDQGWTKNDTGISCTTDVDECKSSHGPRCSANPRVECINLPGSFRCGQCPPGYEGDGYVCSDIDECLTVKPNGGCSTSPMVTCHNTIGSRICGSCPPGYQGDGITCTPSGSCNINRGGCHPSAQCIDMRGLGGRSVQCICPSGMEGDGFGFQGCYVAVSSNETTCETTPCVHGQCHELRNGYTCICYRGYSGARCDVATNLCANNPCLHGGSCRVDESTVRGFRCECTTQYTGDLCHVPTKNCGDLLQAEEGSIVYPLTNNTNYVHNARCAWVIQTVRDKVINVTFSKFNLESSPECLYDFLQIHDGRNAASNMIGRYCGNTMPHGGNIISSDNKLYFWFRSDQTVAKDGFALHWTSVDPVCGGLVNATVHGLISSPGSPGNYPPNRDCYWRLTTSIQNRIQLHFYAFDIEQHSNCSYDYVAIYDGASTSDSLLGMYCNSTQPAPIQSAGPELMIHFHSNEAGTGKGFQISFAPTAGIPGCGGLYTAVKGEIVSPSYNGRYLGNLYCEYKIKLQPDSQIRLNFKEFQLESSVSCMYDYLKVYDGPSSESRLVGKFCGRTFPKFYTSSTNTLFIIFRTDISVSIGEGFKLSYETVCVKTILGDSGFIKSPGYPFNYPASRECTYIIGTNPGKAIELAFQDFDIEESFETDDNCLFDYVEVRDGPDINATVMGTYCGKRIPPNQISTHNYMYLRLVSDMSTTSTGFYANFTSIDTECGGIYKQNVGIINHPDLTMESYKNGQSCTWMIVAPEGMYVRLLWNKFQLENNCNADYVELIEFDQNNGNYSFGKFCGSKVPPAITLSSNKVMVKFESDFSGRYGGFSLSYTFLDSKSHCGSTLARSHGVLYSPGWPNRYEASRDCTWIIIAPMDQRIKLNMSQFDLERPIRDKCIYGDYLEIHDGKSSSAPLIKQFCGQFDSRIILSTSNSLYLHFHSDSYISGKGFKLEWDSTVVGCGGTLTTPSGSISSPNYPDNYHDNSECFYKIVASAGSRIRITFQEIDLERTHKCEADYIEIYDGDDANAEKLGRYCTRDNNLNKIETTKNTAFIKFRSDFFIGGKGFLLDYTTVCQNNVTGFYGVIESPGHPDPYPLGLNCLWTINVPKGNYINVTVVYFDLKETSYWYSYNHNCADYLQFKETSEINYWGKLCGNTLESINSRFSSKTNSLQVNLVTDLHSMPKSGFRLEWAYYGCGRIIQKDYGYISVDKNFINSKELECTWVIESSPGTRISLRVTQVTLKDSVNCTIDAIEVYNGQSTTSPLLSRFCHPASAKIQSTTNIMTVKFIKNSSLKDAAFNAVFDTYTTGCGTTIESSSGVIHSNNYPKNYDKNLDCMWTLKVPTFYRVELQFIDLHLYPDNVNTTDCGDHIKIYDGEYTLNTNYTQIICPNSRISKIISKDHLMGLQFITNSYGEDKGFKANFTVTCGSVINAKYDGIISNDNIFNHYDFNCTWTIIAPSPDQKITLTITHLFIPRDLSIATNRRCPSTYLRVLDGNDENAPLVDEFCGNKVPPTIVSHGSAITIQFGAYDNATITGTFSAHYTSLNTACGGTLTSEKGSIASPGYPMSYPANADCEWTLNTSPGNRVYLTFELLNLDYSDDCNEDYLEVRENDGSGSLLGLYCGNDVPTNTTMASKLYIKFHSDSETTGRGFLLHYGFLPGNEITGAESGEITSPLYPHKYYNTGEYTWRVITREKTTITLTIDHLQIPAYGDFCQNSLIVYDGYDEEATILDEYCGHFISDHKVLHTTSNTVFIKFKIDDPSSGSLFHISWTSSDANMDTEAGKQINCGFNGTQEVERGQMISFNSPNYPNHYENNLNCQWIFKSTSPGNRLVLSFEDINLEETSDCYADSISVYSANKLGEWKPLKEGICLSTFINQVINASSIIKIKFKTDASLSSYKGFKAKINSVCGGVIIDSAGFIEPIWSDMAYFRRTLKKINCEWTIKVRPGRSMFLNFDHFNISNTQGNCETYVTLRNGDSIEAPLIEKYCGSSQDTESLIESSSNAIFVTYSTSMYDVRSFNSFKLRFEEKSVECGVSSRLDDSHRWEIISLPNYPSIPPPYTDCVWTFTGPPGEVLRLDFIGSFDLEPDVNCLIEYVEIRNGLSNLSPSRGKYCGKHKPSSIKTSGNVAYIHYMTSLDQPRNGFRANISIDVCGGTIVASKGEITSPGYPHLPYFPPGTICEWRIQANLRQVLKITINDVHLPTPETNCGTNISIEEKLRVNDTSVQLEKVCADETVIQNVIETSTNEVIIKLEIGKTSQWKVGTEYRGFRFTFNSSRSTCGGTITTPEGYLTTPSYPRETTLRYCQWLIRVPDKNRRIRLELMDVDLRSHTIGIYNDDNFGTLITTMSSETNSNSTQVFESSGNKLSMYLWLHTLVTKHRFKARFSSDDAALCGGDLRGEQGEISAPRLDRSFVCEWIYKGNKNVVKNETHTEFNTIHIIAKVNTTTTNRLHKIGCSYADPKLTLKYDTDMTGAHPHHICGSKEVSLNIPSNILEIKATKGRNDWLDFQLSWQLYPCGGLIHSTDDPVNILVLPKDYNNTIECAWVISVPYENRVELKLEGNFQLGCEDEYVIVKQGAYENSPALALYCKDKTQVEALSTPTRLVIVEYHSKNKHDTTLKVMARTLTNQCGGILMQYNSVFHSPNYPKSYASNTECSWEIVADRGSRVSLHFTDRFFVETSPNCTKDAVIIYDWKDDTYTETSRLCGRNLPPSFNSTYNKMKVVLRTDSEVNGDGFRAIWFDICGGNFTATDEEQYLYSPGYPNSYNPLLDCTYKITSSEKILFKFEDFALEGVYPSCKNDNVTITGYSWDEQVYCGIETPPTSHKYSEITINFKTDSYIQRSGFKISFKNYKCGGSVKESTVLSSGPGNYDDDLNCTWLIEAPTNQKIVLKFQYIDLESGYNSDCYADYISVFNGLKLDESERLAQLCGNINTSVVLRSRGNTMTLQFVTDSSANYNGFKVEVMFTRSELEGCGGNIDLTPTSSKSLQSPLFNGSVVYENFLDCHWEINAPIDYVIRLEFIAFHIASCSGVNQTAIGISNCKCDYVEIVDGVNPNDLKIASYCGHTMPPQLYSSRNKLSVRFSTDGDIVSSGFKATLSLQRSVCGQSIFSATTEVQIISSPGYKTGSIPRGLHCVYHIDMNKYRFGMVRVTIKNLDIRPGEPSELQCNKDKLSINVGHILYNSSVGRDFVYSKQRQTIWLDGSMDLSRFRIPDQYSICGKRQSMDFYLEGSVTIDLQTTAENDHNTYKGVEIEATMATCPRNYTEFQGRIKNSYLNIQSQQIDCYTLITLPENYTMSLYILEIVPVYWNSDLYLDVFDGNTTSSAKLARFDTTMLETLPLFSTGRYVLFHQHNGENEGVTFDIIYAGTDKGQGCGGNLHNTRGQITSPMYPHVYRKKGICEWEIETPLDTRLFLHFNYFNLGVACDQNYVQLVDRSGKQASMFCSETPADYTSEDNYVKVVFKTTMNNGGNGWAADFIAVL